MSYASEVLADSPAAFYRCAEASGLLQDSSGNARHTTAKSTGNPVYQQPSQITSDASDFSIDTTGNNVYYSSPDGAWFDVGDVFTLELWIKRQAGLGTAQGLIGKGADAFYLTLDSDNKIHLQKRGVTDIVATTVTIAETTTWHHCVATKTGSTVKLYVDGADVTGSVTNDTCANNSTALFVLAREDDNFHYQGFADEIAVYPTALSAARVLVHYQAAFAQRQSFYTSRRRMVGSRR